MIMNRPISKIHKASGFTLIELVIVIVLIGILAASALPKFANLTGQARTAAAQGVAGALAAAASVAHSQWIADGASAASGTTISLEGTTIHVTANGWPEGTSATSEGTATAAKCLEVWNGVLSNPPEAGTTCTGTCEFLVTAADPVCSYQDEQGSGSNTITYNINTGAVAI